MNSSQCSGSIHDKPSEIDHKITESTGILHTLEIGSNTLQFVLTAGPNPFPPGKFILYLPVQTDKEFAGIQQNTVSGKVICMQTVGKDHLCTLEKTGIAADHLDDITVDIAFTVRPILHTPGNHSDINITIVRERVLGGHMIDGADKVGPLKARIIGKAFLDIAASHFYYLANGFHML